MKMKKEIILALFALMSLNSIAQTLVSTTPQKRKALIEEYTGVNCQYCPLGHKAIDEIAATYPGQVYSINIHQGTFASRYTTQWGNALAQQAGVQSYPSSTLNRHAFKGASIQIFPSENYVYVPQVLQMDAPVNVAAVVDIDPQTRLMTVRVEAYYTSNSEANNNYLNVAILQSNVYSTQSGGTTYYPENMVNGKYHHKHILRHLLTGQWGDTIYNTTAGSLFTKEYAYVVPHSIGDLTIDNVDDLSVVVFITQNHKEVLNVTEAIRAGQRAYLSYGGVDQNTCSYNVQPFVSVVNATSHPISELQLLVDGESLARQKTLSPYHIDTLHLPALALDPLPDEHFYYQASRTVQLTGYTSEGSHVSINDSPISFPIADFHLYTATPPLTLSIHYDNYPTEVSYSLFGYQDCSYYYQHTGLNNQSQQTVEFTLSPALAGVYRLRLSDVGGDGLNGNISVSDALGNTLFSRNATDLSLWDYYFHLTAPGVDPPLVDIESSASTLLQPTVFPNPISDVLNIMAERLLQAQLFSSTGRLVATTDQPTLHVATLPAGIYLLRIVTTDNVTIKKVIIR